MEPDHYRWQDFVIPPRRTLADLIATVAVIALSVTAIVASSGTTEQASPGPQRVVELTMPSRSQAPTLAISAKRSPVPRFTENCL